MGESKHTPGPWWAEHHIAGAPNSVCVTEDDGAARTIASIPNGAQSNTDANAALIAAAPDMYEALREILAADTEYIEAAITLDSARAALAKAEGR